MLSWKSMNWFSAINGHNWPPALFVKWLALCMICDKYLLNMWNPPIIADDHLNFHPLIEMSIILHWSLLCAGHPNSAPGHNIPCQPVVPVCAWPDKQYKFWLEILWAFAVGSYAWYWMFNGIFQLILAASRCQYTHRNYQEDYAYSYCDGPPGRSRYTSCTFTGQNKRPAQSIFHILVA